MLAGRLASVGLVWIFRLDRNRVVWERRLVRLRLGSTAGNNQCEDDVEWQESNYSHEITYAARE